MVLPTTIATVASALTIIDLTIKFAGYLSPEVKQALYDSRNQIEADNPPSIKAANKILVQSLEMRLPGTSDISIENANQVFPASQCRSQ